MTTVVCVLKLGYDLRAEHVFRLKNLVESFTKKRDIRFVCLTDCEELLESSDVDTLPLVYNLPGWWSMLEMYRADNNDTTVYFDLDITPISELEPLYVFADELEDTEIGLLRAWNQVERGAGNFNTGITCWGQHSRIPEIMLSELINDYAKGFRFVGTHGHGTAKCGVLHVRSGPGKPKRKYENDQFWVTRKLTVNGLKPIVITNLLPNFVQSFKRDLAYGREAPSSNCGIVFYHGHPRPWDIKE